MVKASSPRKSGPTSSRRPALVLFNLPERPVVIKWRVTNPLRNLIIVSGRGPTRLPETRYLVIMLLTAKLTIMTTKAVGTASLRKLTKEQEAAKWTELRKTTGLSSLRHGMKEVKIDE